MSAEQRKRVEYLTRELREKATTTDAVFRCMGATLLRVGDWQTLSHTERERAFVAELEATLDALDYTIKRLCVAE